MRFGVRKADLLASLVVFLIALPLSVGIAVASGVPAELGLVTGIVGGLVAGVVPGSSFRVSGPAAGLTVLVYEAVQAYGLEVLGVLVFAAGLVQLGGGRCGSGGGSGPCPWRSSTGCSPGSGSCWSPGSCTPWVR